jgi:hypothetical protein
VNYPRELLAHDTLRNGQRVYHDDLCCFGRIVLDNADGKTKVICEEPLSGYLHTVTPDDILYHEAIGDRDPHDAE